MNIKVLSLIILSSFIAISACAGIKETNPSSPQFDESKFRFEDYAHFEEFQNAMEAMFPVGTPKKKIDYILVDIGQSSMVDDGAKMKIARKIEDGERIVRYYKKDQSGPLSCSFIVASIYNTKDVLSKKIFAYYGCTGP